MFGLIDYIIFFLTILISLCIGIFFAFWERKRNTTVDYFLAGRKSQILPASLSFAVSFQSSLLVIGFPAEGYVYGVGLAYYAIGITIAFLIAALFVVLVIYPLKLISVYEYLNLRYGNNILRYIALTFGIIYTLFYMATVTVGTCVALNVVMGIPPWGTILIYTVVTAVYTSIGGIKAVIWTDVFQLIIMTGGMVAILIKSSIEIGGLEKVYANAEDRFESTSFNIDPTVRYQFWNVSFGSIISMLYITMTQPSMQRINSLPNVKQASAMFIVGTPIYVIITLIGVFGGPFLFAYFSAKGCDVLEAGIIDNVNAVLPLAVLELFRNQPGLAGLFTASLSSAGLSTMSSCLSSLSAVTYEDIIKVNFKTMKQYQATRLAKVFVLVYGVIALGMSFAILSIPGSISAIFTSFVGCMDGPVTAVFIMSIMSRRVTTKGVFIGLVSGCAFVFWLIVGSNFSDLPPYPYLPHGETEECNIYRTLANVTTEYSFDYNYSSISPWSSSDALLTGSSTISSASNRKDSSSQPLRTIYSISYMLYSLIGLCITVCISIAVSLCTSRQKVIDDRCLFSFKKHLVGYLFQRKQKRTARTTVDNIVDDQEGLTFLTREVEL